MQRAVIVRAKFVPVALALVAVLIGAECVRAAVSHHETIGSAVESAGPADLVAAELDPVFAQKLAARSRRSYECSHQLTASTRD